MGGTLHLSQYTPAGPVHGNVRPVVQTEVLLHLVCLHWHIAQSLHGHQNVCHMHSSSNTFVSDLYGLLPHKAPVMVAVWVDVPTGSHA